MLKSIAALSITALFACSQPAPVPGEGPQSPADGAQAAGGTAAGTASGGSATRVSGTDPVRAQGNIVFLGTSLTAGYGVGAEFAFPAIIQQRIDSLGLPFHVTNAGLSGETSAGGLRRIDWVMQNPLDVFVLELGANDGLRALNVDSMKQNLDAILTRVHAKYPNAQIVIASMEAPPNLGAAYTEKFRAVFPELARKYHAALVPFLLAHVAGIASLNQEDGLHPNPAGHRLVADNVWAVLRPVLEGNTRR